MACKFNFVFILVDSHMQQPPAPGSEPINLIVAVSFGLLIPARIINGAKYGGLNVHPSLLPKYERINF